MPEEKNEITGKAGKVCQDGMLSDDTGSLLVDGMDGTRAGSGRVPGPDNASLPVVLRDHGLRTAG